MIADEMKNVFLLCGSIPPTVNLITYAPNIFGRAVICCGNRRRHQKFPLLPLLSRKSGGKSGYKNLLLKMGLIGTFLRQSLQANKEKTKEKIN